MSCCFRRVASCHSAKRALTFLWSVFSMVSTGLDEVAMRSSDFQNELSICHAQQIYVPGASPSCHARCRDSITWSPFPPVVFTKHSNFNSLSSVFTNCAASMTDFHGTAGSGSKVHDDAVRTVECLSFGSPRMQLQNAHLNQSMTAGRESAVTYDD